MPRPLTSATYGSGEDLLDDRSFRRLLRNATATLFVSLLVPMLILLGMVQYLLRSAHELDHTDQVISEANRVEKMLVTMQSAFRGFRLTGDPAMMVSYTENRSGIDAHLEALAAFVALNPAKAQEIARLKEATNLWIQTADESFARMQTGQSAESQSPYFVAAGRPFRAGLLTAHTFLDEEERERAGRNAAYNRVVQTIMGVFAVVVLAGVPLLLWWLQQLLRKVSASYGISVAAVERRAKELQVTLRSIGDAVVATDALGRVSFLNPVAETLTGWTDAEARGRRLEDVFQIFSERTGQRAENPVARVLAENAGVGLANHTVLRSRQGAECPIEDSAAPIRDEHGSVLGVILVFHDVTRKREADRVLRESERQLRLLDALASATRDLIVPAEIMAVSTRLLGRELGVPRCAYAEVEADQDRFTILDDYMDGCPSLAGSYRLADFGAGVAAELRAGRTLVVRDIEHDPAFGANAGNFTALDIRATVCYPLTKDGVLLAMMAVHSSAPRDWTPVEVKLVSEVVERCWATIERARAESDSRERARMAALRAEIAGSFDSVEPVDRTLQVCCELIVRHVDAAFARIWTIGPGEDVLVLRASAGLYTHLNGPHGRVPVGQFKIGRIAEARRPLFTNDVQHDPNISDPEWARREGMVSFAGYPLMVEGQLVGVLGMFARHVLSATVVADLDPISRSISQHIERKRSEAGLRLARDEAEKEARSALESAERFRLLYEVVALQVWTAGLDGALDYANQECVKYFGADLERDILGGAWAQYVHPEDLPTALAAWTASLATGEPYEVEFRLRAREGNYRWFLARARPMRDGDGRVVKWFGTNTDIDELKRARDLAERASRAKDDFLAALSHELRTPLTPVLITASELRDDARLPAAVREQLGMMERNIALEARLIDDLLDLTAISRGKLQLRAQACDAHSLIGLAIEIVRADARVKDIAIERSFAAARSGLLADPARFQQVIWNLLRNAVKFTPAGGRISIRTRNEAGPDGKEWLRIEVTDSGIGVDPALLDQIFLPFDQGGLTGDHRYGGIGLGLAIARAVVDLHQGRIAAHSDGPNRGSTFVVELPNALPAPDGSRPPAAAGPAPAVTPLRLLLVDDHENTLQSLLLLLRSRGHQVVPAATVGAALAAAAAQPFDLVISDLGLPDGTGTELMEKLRELYGLRGVALSGYGMEEDLARTRKAGFVAHLVKPVHFAELHRIITSLPPP
jgi:PAS domain S-box-containing protein